MESAVDLTSDQTKARSATPLARRLDDETREHKSRCEYRYVLRYVDRHGDVGCWLLKLEHREKVRHK